MAREKLQDATALYAELRTASDRAVAILAAAYLEEYLLLSLLDRLGISDEDVIEDLTGNNGPLGTFSNKIRMAAATGVIGSRTRKEMDWIRKIRNECAHQVNPANFQTQMIKDLANNLGPRYYGSLEYENPSLPEDPRERFVEACHRIAHWLENDVPREAGEVRGWGLD